MKKTLQSLLLFCIFTHHHLYAMEYSFENLPLELQSSCAEHFICSMIENNVAFKTLLRRIYHVRRVSRLFKRLFSGELEQSQRQELSFLKYVPSRLNTQAQEKAYIAEFFKRIICLDYPSDLEKQVLNMLRDYGSSSKKLPVEQFSKECSHFLREALLADSIALANLAASSLSKSPNELESGLLLLIQVALDKPEKSTYVIPLGEILFKECHAEVRTHFIKRIAFLAEFAPEEEFLKGDSLKNYFLRPFMKRAYLNPKDHQEKFCTQTLTAALEESDRDLFQASFDGLMERVNILLLQHNYPGISRSIAAFFAAVHNHKTVVEALMSGGFDEMILSVVLSIAIENRNLDIYHIIVHLLRLNALETLTLLERLDRIASLGILVQVSLLAEIPNRILINEVWKLLPNAEPFNSAESTFLDTVLSKSEEEIVAQMSDYAYAPILRLSATEQIIRTSRTSLGIELALVLVKRGFIKAFGAFLNMPDLFLHSSSYDTLVKLARDLHNEEMIKNIESHQKNIQDSNALEKVLIFQKHLDDGFLPIHILCLFGEYDLVKQMVDAGASVQQQTTSQDQFRGMKLIHCACAGGNVELIKYLITKGSIILEAAAQGKTPFYYAMVQGHKEAMHYLESIGAQGKLPSFMQ